MTDIAKLREQVARAICVQMFAPRDVDSFVDQLAAQMAADAAIRTVLEGIREPSEAARDAGADAMTTADMALKALQAQADEIKRLRTVLADFIRAYDNVAVELNSPDIGGDDIPLRPWHEEWLSHARAALGDDNG